MEIVEPIQGFDLSVTPFVFGSRDLGNNDIINVAAADMSNFTNLRDL